MYWQQCELPYTLSIHRHRYEQAKTECVIRSARTQATKAVSSPFLPMYASTSKWVIRMYVCKWMRYNQRRGRRRRSRKMRGKRSNGNAQRNRWHASNEPIKNIVAHWLIYFRIPQSLQLLKRDWKESWYQSIDTFIPTEFFFTKWSN